MPLAILQLALIDPSLTGAQQALKSFTLQGNTLRQPIDIMAQYFQDLAYALSNCMSCFPGSPKLKINSRSFKILRLLGEVCKPL